MVGGFVVSVVGATVVGSVAGVVVSGSVVGVVVSGFAGSGGGFGAARSGLDVDDGSVAVSAHATANGLTMTASTMVNIIAGNETRTGFRRRARRRAARCDGLRVPPRPIRDPDLMALPSHPR